MGERTALDVAMDLFHRPIAVRDYLHAPLPRDVLAVIRIAAGGEIDTNGFGADQTRRAHEMREACVFFVQQILFHGHADSYRMLGLRPDANSRQVQDHKRMLLKWLHPDRNHNKWEQALFQRVIQAAAEIEQKSQIEIIAPNAKPEYRARTRRLRPRPHPALGLQRVPLKRRSRAKLIKYLKRGLLVAGFGGAALGGAQMFTGGDPFDVSYWGEILDFNWVKLYF